mmetsp:Transcript_14125/g.20697  ORF Transcript_14125/g.20697 Transcript_14125/m.20697 type:complete len:107 (+) Transcript_14125:812-1132(+)
MILLMASFDLAQCGSNHWKSAADGFRKITKLGFLTVPCVPFIPLIYVMALHHVEFIMIPAFAKAILEVHWLAIVAAWQASYLGVLAKAIIVAMTTRLLQECLLCMT